MHQRLGCEDVGPLADQGRWKAERQIRREAEFGQIEPRRCPLGRGFANQYGERILARRLLLTDRRQQRAVVGELGLGAQHIETRSAARCEFELHQCEILLVIADDLGQRADLLTQSREGQCFRDGVAGNRKMRGGQLIALRISERLLRFHAPCGEPEDIRREAHRRPERVQIEYRKTLSRGQECQSKRRPLLALRRRGEIYLWIVGAASLDYGLLRLRERGFGRIESGIAYEGFVNNAIERPRVETLPPCSRNCLSNGERLGRLADTGR